MDEYNNETSIRGTIVSFEWCGCHRMGVRKDDGTYIQLKSGMRIVGYLIPEGEEKNDH